MPASRAAAQAGISSAASWMTRKENALCSIAAYAPAGNTYAAYSDEAITEKQAKGTKNQKVRHKYKLLPAAKTFAQELDLFTGMGYGLSG